MDDRFALPSNSTVSEEEETGGGGGAFERFLTSAIATILTIIFSWRILMDHDSHEGRRLEFRSREDLPSGREARGSGYVEGKPTGVAGENEHSHNNKDQTYSHPAGHTHADTGEGGLLLSSPSVSTPPDPSCGGDDSFRSTGGAATRTPGELTEQTTFNADATLSSERVVPVRFQCLRGERGSHNNTQPGVRHVDSRQGDVGGGDSTGINTFIKQRDQLGHRNAGSASGSDNNKQTDMDKDVLDSVREQYNRMVRQANNTDPRYINSSDTSEEDNEEDDNSVTTMEKKTSEDSCSDESLGAVYYSSGGGGGGEREYSLGEQLGEDSSDSEYCVVFKRVLEVITEEDTDDVDTAADVTTGDTDAEVYDIPADDESGASSDTQIEMVAHGNVLRRGIRVVRGGGGVGRGGRVGNTVRASSVPGPQQHHQQQPLEIATAVAIVESRGSHETTRDDNKTTADGAETTQGKIRRELDSDSASTSSDEVICVTAAVFPAHRDGRASSLDFLHGVTAAVSAGPAAPCASSTPPPIAFIAAAELEALSDTPTDHSTGRLTGSTLTITPGGVADEWSESDLTDTNSIDVTVDPDPRDPAEAERARRYGGAIGTIRPVTIGPYHDRLSQFTKRNYIGVTAPPPWYGGGISDSPRRIAETTVNGNFQPAALSHSGNHSDTPGASDSSGESDKQRLIKCTDTGEPVSTDDNGEGDEAGGPGVARGKLSSVGTGERTTIGGTGGQSVCRLTGSTDAPDRCDRTVVSVFHLKPSSTTPGLPPFKLKPTEEGGQRSLEGDLSSQDRVSKEKTRLESQNGVSLDLRSQDNEGRAVISDSNISSTGHNDDYLHTQYYTQARPTPRGPPSTAGSSNSSRSTLEYDTAEDASSTGRYRTPDAWSSVESAGEEALEHMSTRAPSSGPGDKINATAFRGADEGDNEIGMPGVLTPGNYGDNNTSAHVNQTVSSVRQRPLNVGARQTAPHPGGSPDATPLYSDERGAFQGLHAPSTVTNWLPIGSGSESCQLATTSKPTPTARAPAGFHGDSSAAMEADNKRADRVPVGADSYSAPNIAHPGGNQRTATGRTERSSTVCEAIDHQEEHAADLPPGVTDPTLYERQAPLGTLVSGRQVPACSQPPASTQLRTAPVKNSSDAAPAQTEVALRTAGTTGSECVDGGVPRRSDHSPGGESETKVYYSSKYHDTNTEREPTGRQPGAGGVGGLRYPEVVSIAEKTGPVNAPHGLPPDHHVDGGLEVNTGHGPPRDGRALSPHAHDHVGGEGLGVGQGAGARTTHPYTDATPSTVTEGPQRTFTFVTTKSVVTDFTFSSRPNEDVSQGLRSESESGSVGESVAGTGSGRHGGDLTGSESGVIFDTAGDPGDTGMLTADTDKTARGGGRDLQRSLPPPVYQRASSRTHGARHASPQYNYPDNYSNSRQGAARSGTYYPDNTTHPPPGPFSPGGQIPTGIFYHPEDDQPPSPRRPPPGAATGAEEEQRRPASAMGNNQAHLGDYEGNDVDVDERFVYGHVVGPTSGTPQRAPLGTYPAYHGDGSDVLRSPERQPDVRYAAIKRTDGTLQSDGSGKKPHHGDQINSKREYEKHDGNSKYANEPAGFDTRNGRYGGRYTRSPEPRHVDYGEGQIFDGRQHMSQLGGGVRRPTSDYDKYTQVNRPGADPNIRHSWPESVSDSSEGSQPTHWSHSDRAIIPHSQTEIPARAQDLSFYAQPPLRSPRSCTALATSTALARKDSGPYGDSLPADDISRSVVSAIGNAEATGENPYIAVARATARAATIASANAAAGVAKTPQEYDGDETSSDINVVISTSCTIRDENLKKLESDGHDVIDVMDNQPGTRYQHQLHDARRMEALPSSASKQQQHQPQQRTLSRDESLDGPKKMVITIEQEGSAGLRERKSRTVECELPQKPNDTDLTRVISSAVKRILKSSGQRHDVRDTDLNDVIERVTQQVVDAYTTDREPSVAGGDGGRSTRPSHYPYQQTFTSQPARPPARRMCNEAVPGFRGGPRVDKDSYRELHRVHRKDNEDDDLAKYAIPVNSYGHRLQHKSKPSRPELGHGHGRGQGQGQGRGQYDGKGDKEQTYFYVTGTGPTCSPVSGLVEEVVLKVATDDELKPTVEHVTLSETESGSEAGTPLPLRRGVDVMRDNQHQRQYHKPQQQEQYNGFSGQTSARPRTTVPSHEKPFTAPECDGGQRKIRGILRTSPKPDTYYEDNYRNNIPQRHAEIKPSIPHQKRTYDSVLLKPVHDKRTPYNVAKRYESPEKQPTEQRSKLDDARKGYLDMVPKNPPWPQNTVLDAAFEEKKRRWFEKPNTTPSSGLMVVDIDIDQKTFQNDRAKSQSSEQLKKRLSSARLKAPNSSDIDQRWQSFASLKPYKSQGNLLDRTALDNNQSRTRHDSAGSTTSADLRRVRSLGTLPSQFFSERRSYTSLMETDLDTGICTTTPLIYETDLDQVRNSKAKSLTNLSVTPSMVPIDLDEDRRKSMDTLPREGQELMYSLPREGSDNSSNTGSLDTTQERSLSAGELRITQSLNKLSIPDWYRSSFGKGKKAVELTNTRQLRDSGSGDLLDSSFESTHSSLDRKPPTPPRPIVIQHRVSNTMRSKSPGNSAPTTPVGKQQFELPSSKLKHTHVELKPMSTKSLQKVPVQIPKKQSAKEAYLRLKAHCETQKEILTSNTNTYGERPLKSEKTVIVEKVPVERADWYVAKSYINLNPGLSQGQDGRERMDSSGNDSGLGPSPGHDQSHTLQDHLVGNKMQSYDPGNTCTELIEEMKLSDNDDGLKKELSTNDPVVRMMDNIETSRREIQEKAYQITTDPRVPEGLLNRGEPMNPRECFPVLSYVDSPPSRRKQFEADSYDSDRDNSQSKISEGNNNNSLDQVVGGLLALPDSSNPSQSPRSDVGHNEDDDEDEDMSPKSRVFRMLRQAATPRGSMVSVNTSKTMENLSDTEDNSDGKPVNDSPSTARSPSMDNEDRLSEESALVKCSNRKCKKSTVLQEARKTYKTCHNCYTYYCSRECRKAHWSKHKQKCLFSRVNSMCKHIVKMIHDTPETLEYISRIARTGYMSKGRGCVLLAFPSPEKAEIFLEENSSELKPPPGYANLSDLQEETDILGEHHTELVEMCKTYNPDIKFVIEIAIVAGQEVAASAMPRREGPAIKKCARLRLSQIQPKVTTSLPKSEPETLILTALPGSEFTENMEEKKAREICFVNIQRKLRQRGVTLRHHFPDVYQKLCAYVAENEHFAPMTIYPLDINTGKRFMCLIMPNAEPEVEWMHNPDLLDELGLATQV